MPISLPTANLSKLLIATIIAVEPKKLAVKGMVFICSAEESILPRIEKAADESPNRHASRSVVSIVS
ncbi:hypothetical protein D3C76_1345200 [compost metagenome]